jgi:hypothetical protein
MHYKKMAGTKTSYALCNVSCHINQTHEYQHAIQWKKRRKVLNKYPWIWWSKEAPGWTLTVCIPIDFKGLQTVRTCVSILKF